MKNRLLTLRSALLLFLLLGTVLIASAQYDFYQNGIKYRVTGDGTVAVTSVYSSIGYSGSIVIPAMVQTSVFSYGNDYDLMYVVTSVDSYAFRNSTQLTNIELPNTVKSIGDRAFYGCTSLSSVSLSNGLETIGESAFGNCSALRSITVPNSVQSLGWNVFYGCSALTNATLPNNIRELNGSFFGCTSLESVNIPGATVILDGSFSGCTSLKSIVIPNSVTHIGENTFKDCSALTSVSIPNSVEEIGDYAFANTGLTSVSFPSTLTNIGQNVFYGCNQLASVTARPVTPPTMASQNTFIQWTYDNAKLIVPQVAVNTYKSKNWWKLFKDVSGNASLNNSYDFASGGIYYIIVDDSSVEVTYKDANYGSYNGSITIPATISNGGKTYNVTRVGYRAFYGSTGLTNVTFPASLTTIAAEAFYGCSGLTSLTIPQNVTAIGPEAFEGCFGLTNLTWNAKNCLSNGNLSSGSINSVTIGSNVQTLPMGFVANSRITMVNIPSSVIHIGSEAFKGCTELSSLTIPERVTNIGKDAFAECSGLRSLIWNAKDSKSNGNMSTDNITQVTIGSQVIALPDRFVWHSRITQVTLPASLKYIGCEAFYYCSRLSEVNLPSSLESIGAYAFASCSAITNLTIPRLVSSIGEFAFSECNGISNLTWNAIKCGSNGNMPTSNITQVAIGNEVKKLPRGFACDSKITTVNIPNSVDTIYSEAFSRCAGLTSVILPNSVKSLGSGAFSECTGLTNVNLSTSIETINGFAFSYCSSLTEVAIPESVKTIDYDAFSHCTSLEKLTIGKGVSEISADAFMGCSSLAVIDVNSGNITYDSRDNCNAIIEKVSNSLILGCKSTVIPGTVTSIGSFAFSGCAGLTSLTIPNSVTSIGSSAFSGCAGLTSLTIPNSVTSIGSDAFSYCTGLSSITIPNSVRSIEYGAFYECTGLTKVEISSIESWCNISFGSIIFSNPLYYAHHLYLNGEEVIDLVIPNTVTVIHGYSFSGCTGLTSVKIPDAVTSIGSSAFNGCTGLTSVSIGSSVSSIGNSAFSGCSSLLSVICWPFTPPSFGYYSNQFYGTPESMTVYVPAVALENYLSNYFWNRFHIEPIKSSTKLTVNMPAGVDVSTYANMDLAISSLSSDRTLNYVLSDKRSYSFFVDRNTSWKVTLTNQYGDVFGKIDQVDVGEEDASVTLPSLKKPQTVTLKVKTPTGQYVTANVTVSWYDESGELLSQGNQIAGLPVGRKLTYSVKLPQELAMVYSLPANTTYTVKDGTNEIICQLTAIAQTHLSGKVKETVTNQPLYGATISATQTFAGGNTKTTTATTDNQGAFTLDASSVPTTLTVAAQGYISQSINCDELMTGGSNITVPDVALSPITGAVVNVNLTYTPAHVEGEAVETQNWYSDYNNVDYEVYNKTTGRTITNISVQYPQIVLMEDVNDGDVLELTATSRKDAFNPVKATVTIAEQKATATFNIKELGKVAASFRENTNEAVVGMLYDSDRKLVKTADYSGDSMTMDDLSDGSYRLVTMGKSDLLNTIYDMREFPTIGLSSGEDYVNSSVVVNEGIISKVIIDEVPFLDESKLYYTGENTSFTVNKPSIVVGNYLTFRTQVDFKEEYVSKVTDVQLIIDLPESCHFYENSVLVGSSTGTYTLSGNKITIPMANYEDVVRFCAIPTEAGDFAPSAFVKFKIRGKSGYVIQPIGAANYTVTGLSINVPSRVARQSIPISGTAPGAMSISVYDNGVLIGETTSLQNGSWTADCELYKPYNLSNHNIFAIATTDTGLELKSEVKTCIYDKYAIEVSKVHMYYKNSDILFDYLNPNDELSNYYSYVPGYPDFTFTVDFTDNDTTKICDVTLYVKTTDNKWRSLEATFDTNKSSWVTSGKFYQEALPINVSVDYLCITDDEVDNSFLNDILKEWDDIIARDDSTINNVNNVIDGLLAKLKNGNLSQEELLDSLECVLEFVDLSKFVITPEIQDILDYLRDLNGTELANALDAELENHHYEISNDFEVEYQQLVTPIQQVLPSVNDLPKYDVLMNEAIETLDPLLFVCDIDQYFNMISSKRHNRNFGVIKLIHENGSVITIDLSEKLPYPLDDSDESFEQWGYDAMDLFNIYSSASGSTTSIFNAVDDNARIIKSKAFQELMFKKIVIRNINWNQYVPDDAIESLLNEVKIDANNYNKASKVSNITSKCVESSTRISTAFGVVSAFTGGWSIGSDIREGWNTTKDWRRMIDKIKECPNPDAQELAKKAENYKQWIKDRYGLKGYADLAATGMGIVGVVAAPETFGTSLLLNVGSGLISLSTNYWEKNFKVTNSRHWNEVYREYRKLRCDSEESPDTIVIRIVDYPLGYPYNGLNARPSIDPSGFVYEGVPSNRLQGVTATCYYKETVEDMYGDTHEEVVLWDAEQYGQQNPLLTDENGYYRWDVPIGMWQVKYEKAGYETTYSDWLPVPPPQLDVNIGMVQMRQPEVIKARAYPQAVEFEFDKFMLPETLTSDNITVSVNGNAVSGTIEMLNAEVDDPQAITSLRRSPGTGLTLASRVRFNANSPFNADRVTLHIKQEVESYAELRMNEDYEAVLPVEYEMERIAVDSTLIVPYGDSRQLTVTVEPAMASKGKTLTVRNASPMILSTDAESYTLDSNGKAVVTVHGDLPGAGSLLFGIDGYDLSAATLVNVLMESQMTVAMPTASIASGSEVEKGTAVYLNCSTPGATIYYTLDGSCPCDNTPARKVYDGSPIIINSTTTIKAMATAPDLYDSYVATFVYRVAGGKKGDVNGDGEVNVADVNTAIDIILGGHADSDTRARADVNGDGEINLADINAIIDIILGAHHTLKHVVNCDDLLHLDDVTMKPGEVKTLQVTVDHAARYSALQCDIVLPAGLTLVDVYAPGTNTIRTGGVNDNTCRALNYSMARHTFVGDMQPVMTFTVRADAALAPESEITLTDVVLADAQGKAWHIADAVARVNNASGVNDLTADKDRVWVEGHTLFIETRQDGTAQLAMVNGMVSDIPLKAGINRQRLDRGIYIVVINGQSHKIAIK